MVNLTKGQAQLSFFCFAIGAHYEQFTNTPTMDSILKTQLYVIYIAHI